MAKGTMGFITRTYAYVQRYRQILFVLIRYGFDDLIATLGVEQHLDIGWIPFTRKRKDKQVEALSSAARIRLVLQELGPTFIKMGQTLSTRSDLLSEDVLSELVKLQDDVPSFPVAEAKKIVERELAAPCSELFAWFDEQPLAAGSIGQVHRGRLHSGEEVVLKIQRPGIRKTIQVDLEIIHHLASLMERHMELGHVHKPTSVADEFARTLRAELDYNIEAANLERFTRLFEDNPHVSIHPLYRDYTTDKVLTVGYVEGTKPTKHERLLSRGLDPQEIAARGCELVMDQIFSHGFFHADPHPGNIMVLADNVICFLDFGMVGRIDRQSREQFADLLANVVSHNEVKAAEALLKLTHSHALVDRLSLEREITELIDRYLYRPLKDLEVGKLIRRLLDLTVKYELRIPAHFFLLIKAVSQIEDLGRSLDPDFDFAAQATPHIRRLLLNRYHPKRVLRDFYETASDMAYLVKEVPGEVRELLKQAKRGQMKIELEHLGLRPLQNTLQRLSNRISSAIVLASLIVGSSVIVHSNVPPTWHEIPVIGLAGFLISGVMGFALLRSIAKDRSR